MKLLDFIKSKKKSKENNLLKDYEEGKILQVDNDVDNKEFMKEK